MINKTTTLLIFSLLILGCETASDLGGSEAGNPPATIRQLSGSVEAEESDTDSSYSALTATSVDVPCKADVVTATATDDTTTEALISSECHFIIELPIDTAYVISFYKDEAFVATIYFTDDDEGLETPYLYLASGEEVIDLGLILFDSAHASVEIEPATQQDLDGDDLADYDDDDDNNDETPDLDQPDCDLDGLWDEIDGDTTSCTVAGGEDTGTDTGTSTDTGTDTGSGGSQETDVARVLSVSPTDGAGTLYQLLAVALSVDVSARFDCKIDDATVTADTFSVVDEDGINVACDYEFSASGKIVKCTHDTDLFDVATTYTATIDGVACDTEPAGEATTWSWKTISLSLF